MKKNFNDLIELVYILSSNKDIKLREEIAIKMIPELAAFRANLCHHPAHKYDDILEHSLEAVQLVDHYITPNDDYSYFDIAVMKIVLLLHDIGKTVTKTLDENGITHFYSHPYESAKIVDEILNKYNIDEQIKLTIINLVREHDTKMDNENQLMHMINRIGLKDMGMLLKIQRADINTHADWYAKKRNPMLNQLEISYDKIKYSYKK